VNSGELLDSKEINMKFKKEEKIIIDLKNNMIKVTLVIIVIINITAIILINNKIDKLSNKVNTVKNIEQTQISNQNEINLLRDQIYSLEIDVDGIINNTQEK